jgi:HD-like signal output (HDOD) protein
MSFLNLLKPKKEAAPEQSPIDVLKKSVGTVEKLPMMPEAATKAMEVANSPNSSLKDFASVIERDVPLAAGILKLANSPLYRVGREITSLDQAVVRLGLRECKNLIVTVGMRSLWGNGKIAKKKECETLWQHAFLTACLCRRMNKAMGMSYQGEEFSCGLSHDLGRILFAVGIPNHFDKVDTLSFQEGPDLLAKEDELIGLNHCQFGAWFATVNQLPGSIAEVIQHHHQPAKATSHQMLVGLVTFCDQLANHVFVSKSAEGVDLNQNLGWQFLTTKLDDGVRERVEAQLVTSLTESVREAEQVAKI